MEAIIVLQQKQLPEKCLIQNEKTETLLARQIKLEEEREGKRQEGRGQPSYRKRL